MTSTEIVGSFSDVDRINAALARANEAFHLISPASFCPPLPSGCVVTFAAIPIDPETETHDVGGGKRSLLRTALLKLANAAGICWDSNASGRIDDARSPYCVHWRAVGAWRDLGTSWLPIVADYRMDLRDGTAQTQKVLESAHAVVGRDGKIVKSAEEVGRIQLRDMRAKILERAQSGAKLRGIREALHIRAYARAELETRSIEDQPPTGKAFLVARSMYIGTGDLEDRRAIRESFLAGSAALFGASHRALPPARAPELTPDPIPPSPATTDDGEFVSEPLMCEYCGKTEGVEEEPGVPGQPIRRCGDPRCQTLARADRERAAPARTPSSPPPPPPQAPAPRAAAPQARPAQARTETHPTTTSSMDEIRPKFGRQKGQLLSEHTAQNLRWLGDAVHASLQDPEKARFRADNERLLAAIGEEEARRGSRKPAPEPQQTSLLHPEEDQIPF